MPARDRQGLRTKMPTPADRWAELYHQIPLCDLPYHFANLNRSPFLLDYLATVLQLCPRGERTLETGIGSGFGAVWLSLRGVQAEGLDYAPGIVERAKAANNLLGGCARFRVGDLFRLYEPERQRYQAIHHQGVLEHFTVPQIRAALAQQVASAHWVVFSVPSVFYAFAPEFGDERLLPIEEWRRILAPFDVADLRYYGNPGQERDHILGVLRGQPVDPELRALMIVPEEPFPQGISAIVHTKNEARHIAECLETLQGWTDETIVCDMESTDDTVEIARRFTDNILPHPQLDNFDRARNVSAMRAAYRWVFYLDADERVPPGLGACLRDMVTRQGDSFEAVLIPFRHHFAGQWMQCLYPGYTSPRLFKNGKFVFHARLHSGAQVDGRTVRFPADNPDLALVHYSYDSVSHYLTKLNRYTDGEAANLHRDRQPFLWQNAIAHFVQDFQSYYDGRGAARDGVHGFLYTFFSGFYRFAQHAKLYEQRYREGSLQPQEQQVPASLEQMLEYALAVARQKPLPQAPEIRVEASPASASIVWSGPLTDPSGYGEESRHFLLALEEAGASVAGHLLPWSRDEVNPSAVERKRLSDLLEKPAAPGFVQIVQNFPTAFARHPLAGASIGRTMFETDRLPADWVQGCNRMDAILVPSEFNKVTFARAGVQAEVAVVPGCFDPAEYVGPGEETPLSRQIRESGRYTFLSVFDWTRHKGWDVLLRSFLAAFEGRDDAELVLKVWSTMGYSPEQIQEQAAAFVKERLGHELLNDARVRFVTERLSRPELLALYRACDAFVLPSRGEGWGRPYMEAMACGLPTIGTNWSGNTAFMTAENSYLLGYELADVPEEGWREIPTYRGHRWAEPSLSDCTTQMKHVFEERGEAEKRGLLAKEEVTARFCRTVVGKLLAQEIERIREARQPHPVGTAPGIADAQAVTGSKQKQGNGRRKDKASAETSPETKSIPSVLPGVAVRWEGAQFVWHSLAHVNRELCLGLLGTPGVELSLLPTEPTHFPPEQEPRFTALAPRCFATLSRPADVHVRHFFPPRFEKPEEGALVLIQPWEYGFLPERWIEPIKENVREVWCYSQYVKDVYLASGIPEERLQVVPLGADTEVFTPAAPPYVFTTEPGAEAIRNEGGQKRFVFLFAGGTLHRKGIDILLDAYLKAFSAYDDVCLVIKDTGTETVYRGQNERGRILALTQDPTRPPIVYLDADLSAHQLAGVYTAADCLVQPYRGEGFCLPALEAMACGVPVLVPAGGPTDDFVDDTVGWRMEAERRPFGNGRIGDWDCVGPTWMFEVSVDTLARHMRRIFAQPDEAKARGAASLKRVREDWTWKHACEAAARRLEALAKEAHVTQTPIPETKTLPVATPIRAKAEEPSDGSGVRDRRAIAAPKKSATSKEAPSKAKGRPRAEISLCMIVRNEERVLGDCLKSVKEWVDEIILVDTGSTDKTVEIAKEHGAKVFHFPWCDDFSAARNVSLEHATKEWLFWMDADDTLPEACGKRLHEVVSLVEDRVAGILMQVHIPPAPGDSGFTIVDHVKLFRNRPEHRFTGRIHEQILEPIYQNGGQVQRSDLYVVHSGYDYSPEGQQKKRERDLTILEKDLKDRPDHPFVLFNIGMTAFHLKEFDRAIPALERCLEKSKPHESTVRKVYAMLSSCHLEKRDLVNARIRLEQGLALFPKDPELLFRAGNLYRELGDLQAAERSYVALLTARETGHLDSLDVSMAGFKGHHNLALIYQDQGKWNEAETHWKAALSDNPTFAPSWMGLAELYLKLRRFEDARAILCRLAEIAPDAAEGLSQRIMQAAGHEAMALHPPRSGVGELRSPSTPKANIGPTKSHPNKATDLCGASTVASAPGEPDWSLAPEFGRREMLLAALHRLWQLHPGPTCLVETGTLRDDAQSACSGDGWSTVAWAWYAARTGGKAVTVDINPDYIATCRRKTAPYAAHMEYVCADSPAFLRQWVETHREPIHLLYLDSLDYENREVSELHCLNEAQTALPALAPTCLVLFDDTSPTGSAGTDGLPPLIGKGTRAVPHLLSQGFRLEWCLGGQVLLSRGTENNAAG